MSAFDIVITVLISVGVIAVIAVKIRDGLTGKRGCDCDCSSCSGCKNK